VDVSTKDRSLSELGLALARSLIGDLASLGHGIEVAGGVARYARAPVEGSNRTFYREAHVRLHDAHLHEQRDRILELEDHLAPRFIEGVDVDLSAVAPRLRAVDLRRASATSARDRAAVEYIRSYQTVGSKMSVGRENAFILEDLGQPSVPIMGALVLASPRYFQPRRDEVLGWPTPSGLAGLGEADRSRWRAVREAGLRRIMHVAICCALPPYSQLGAARLLAVAPFTPEVQQAFVGRWRGSDADPDLAFVTTTSSMGRTGTPFQNLRPALYFDPGISPHRGEKWNRDAKLYARLGEVHPWRRDVAIRAPEPYANFRTLMSEETKDLADQFIVAEQLGDGISDRSLNRAIRRIGLSPEVFRGNPIGVFIGAIDRESVEAVATGVPRRNRPVLSWELAVRKFRSDFGAEPDPERKTGVDKTARAEAVVARRARAKAVKMDDILLSRRHVEEAAGQFGD
jgi:hypothetical protein